MPMNRLDLMGQALPRAFRGYARGDVDRLLQDLSDSLARLSEEKLALAARVARLEETLAEHRQREVALQEALGAARSMGDTIKDTAQKRSAGDSGHSQNQSGRAFGQCQPAFGQNHGGSGGSQKSQSPI